MHLKSGERSRPFRFHFYSHKPTKSKVPTSLESFLCLRADFEHLHSLNFLPENCAIRNMFLGFKLIAFLFDCILINEKKKRFGRTQRLQSLWGVQPTNVILQRETNVVMFFNLGSSGEGTISFSSNFISSDRGK